MDVLPADREDGVEYVGVTVRVGLDEGSDVSISDLALIVTLTHAPCDPAFDGLRLPKNPVPLDDDGIARFDWPRRALGEVRVEPLVPSVGEVRVATLERTTDESDVEIEFALGRLSADE